MIKAIIFDCFGVVIGDGLHALAAELQPGNPNVSAEIFGLVNWANKGRMSSAELTGQLAQVFGLSVVDYRARVAEGEVKDQALLEYIAGLRVGYKTAMLSNAPDQSLSSRFEPGELERYFDVVVVSGEIGYAKPEPEAYEITAERLGVRLDECVFTDDRQPYVDGAQAVGMRTILYEDLPQLRAELETLLADS